MLFDRDARQGKHPNSRIGGVTVADPALRRAVSLGSSRLKTDMVGLSTYRHRLLTEKKLYNTQHNTVIAVEVMRSKTFLRSAARTIGMDPGNLSRLARNYGVPVDDEAALTALGRIHQREPAPDSHSVVPASLAIQLLDRLFKDDNRQFHERSLKFKECQDEGKKLLRDSIQECNRLREFILQTNAALEPVLKAPWHGNEGINLTAEQSASIQDCFGDDWAEGLEALRQRQNEMESLIAETTERPPAN